MNSNQVLNVEAGIAPWGGLGIITSRRDQRSIFREIGILKICIFLGTAVFLGGGCQTNAVFLSILYFHLYLFWIELSFLDLLFYHIVLTFC